MLKTLLVSVISVENKVEELNLLLNCRLFLNNIAFRLFHEHKLEMMTDKKENGRSVVYKYTGKE